MTEQNGLEPMQDNSELVEICDKKCLTFPRAASTLITS